MEEIHITLKTFLIISHLVTQLHPQCRRLALVWIRVHTANHVRRRPAVAIGVAKGKPKWQSLLLKGVCRCVR